MRFIKKTVAILIAIWVISLLVGGSGAVVSLLLECINLFMPVVIVLVGIALMLSSLFK